MKQRVTPQKRRRMILQKRRRMKQRVGYVLNGGDTLARHGQIRQFGLPPPHTQASANTPLHYTRQAEQSSNVFRLGRTLGNRALVRFLRAHSPCPQIPPPAIPLFPSQYVSSLLFSLFSSSSRRAIAARALPIHPRGKRSLHPPPHAPRVRPAGRISRFRPCSPTSPCG